MRHVLAFLLLATPAAAQDCPEWSPQVERQAEILERLQASGSEIEARGISRELWLIWLNAPDNYAQDLLDNGMSRREMADLGGAEIAFTTLIEYCPDYPEGWNQRAFARFLRQDYEGALTDLEIAIRLSPAHVAAIAGKALTLFGLEREEEGQAVLRDALALNPWLSERHLLREPEGDEL